MRIDCEANALTVMAGALGIVAAMTLSAPTALADPPPVPEPAPAPAPPPPPPPLFPWLAPPAAPVAAPADPAIPPPAPAPGPVPEETVHSAAGDPAVPHLPSPENLPPGTSDAPVPQQGNGSYLRDLWHAYQTQEISGRDALLLLTQRPMDADAVPPPGMPANPTPPLPPAPPLSEAAPAPPPAP